MEDDYSYDNDSFFSDRRQSSFCMGLDKVPVWPGTVLHLPAVVCAGSTFRCISCCVASDCYSRPDFRAGIYESDMRDLSPVRFDRTLSLFSCIHGMRIVNRRNVPLSHGYLKLLLQHMV